ncbi:complement C1q-like protein 3 [Mya arenaria]|uniref:complement C1q-like protein 3 n=1 Tax=Mya arenaria TaxID=6604 RepID=UPI0022E94861|nr:complement C1q-like protein 3 [Mya arenaria]XP_052791918.1 complement C1q-like protein 3 [Mya arenaria]
MTRQDGTSKAHSRDDKDDDSNPSGDNINHDAPTTLKLPPWLLSRQRLAVGNAAISVYLSQSKQHMTNEAIKFDRILLNDGNVYNTFTGAFTAPLSGIYLFTYHFDSTTSTFVRLVRLVVNGVNEVDAVANPHVVSGPRQAQSMGGNTCIIHVSHGQAVQIQVYEIPDTTIDSSDNFHFLRFLASCCINICQ